MTAFLLTWNPKKWNFEGGYASVLQCIKTGEEYIEEWSVSNSSIRPGDDLYLMKLGDKPRGIVAKAIAMSTPHDAPHWNEKLAKQGVKIKFVTVKFTAAVDYEKDGFLDWDLLRIKFPKQNWTPQNSGISIKNEYCNALAEEWDKYSVKTLDSVLGISQASSFADDINIPQRPKRIIKGINGVIVYTCGKCGVAFEQAPRCPECGQLMKMQGAD